MKNLLLLIAAFILFSQTQAQELKIEPLYGIEKKYRLYPAPGKVETTTFFGARATYGVPLLSAELEISQSDDTEFYPIPNETVKYKSQRAMLGVRSYPLTSKMFGWFLRAGVRAQKDTTESTISGVTTKNEGDLEIDPYAGTGVSIAIANMFALNAGATMIYNKNAPDSDKFDTQYTLSFSIKAGNVR